MYFFGMIVIYWLTGISYGQKVILEGRILDSIDQGLANTNLIASPIEEAGGITFAIADSDGSYQLKLNKEIPYKIEITSLGYSSLTDTLQLAKDTVKDYVLNQNHEQLEQVLVEAKMAMIVKEDTITYRTDSFRTGDERKLREILKKLPGVEVDRQGNVTVNGKKVSKLMVDGQDFFGGDTRLGVNNIPADAVEEVEAIDNYNEVSFMKGLSDSDRMAMNIKLKKDKKDFVFGETEAGGGIEKRYYIHPSVFYYSPNTTLNFIGSLNNSNESPLDFQDVTRFKGGFMSFIDNPINSGDAGLTQFSTSGDALHKKIQFGAANFTQKIGPDLRLEAYSIVAKQETLTEDESLTEYLTQESLKENRKSEATNRNFNNFNKIRLRYTPDLHKDLAYDILANFSNNDYQNTINSRIGDSLNHIRSRQDPHNIDLNQYLRYNTQPTYEHTSEIRAEHSFKKTSRHANWDFDRPVFSELIPFMKDPESDDYNFLQDYSSITHSGRFNFKHYWVLNNVNHLYPVGGLYFFNQSYSTFDYQRMQNGQIHDFGSNGFNNDLHYTLIDPYVGFQYKFKIGEITFRPGLVYHHYFWKVNQFAEKITSQDKGVFLPEFKLEYKPQSGQQLEFTYNLKSGFADAEKYANRLSLKSFNRLYRGNADLENSLYHWFNFSFRNFNLSNGINYRVIADYRRQEKSIQNTTQLKGIDQITTSYYSGFPENNYSIDGTFNKRWKHLSTGIATRASMADYSQFINDEKLDYQTQNLVYRLRARTLFKNLPNLEVGVQQRFNKTTNQTYKNRYTSFSPFVMLEYAFLNGFIFKADYDYTRTKDHTTHQRQNFQIGNASFFYRAEDSPWGFEIRLDNAFDVTAKRRHSFDEFMIYDQQVFIQPRTALFILSYQL